MSGAFPLSCVSSSSSSVPISNKTRSRLPVAGGDVSSSAFGGGSSSSFRESFLSPLSISPSPSIGHLSSSARSLRSADNSNKIKKSSVGVSTGQPFQHIEGFRAAEVPPSADNTPPSWQDESRRRLSSDGTSDPSLKPRGFSFGESEKISSELANILNPPKSPTRSLLSEQISVGEQKTAPGGGGGGGSSSSTQQILPTSANNTNNKQTNNDIVASARRLARACEHDAALAAAAASLSFENNLKEIPVAPLGAASQILSELGVDDATVAAGMLSSGAHANHTRLRSGDDASLAEVTSHEVARLVAGVAQMADVSARLRNRSDALDDELHLEKSRTMFLAMADVRVCLAFLADRLATLRVLAEQTTAGESLSQVRRVYVLESLRVFAPIANRLGVWGWKAELEDMCFQLLHAEEHANLRRRVEERHKLSNIGTYMNQVREVLDAREVKFASISGRPKNLYSLWKKLSKKQVELSEVHDVMAMRVIVHRSYDCYAALDLVHELFEPVPGKLKDYVRSPKENGYRSLHTVVSDGNGGTFEVQIRTEDMHREAELGVASHWRYKESGGSSRHPAHVVSGPSSASEVHGGGVADALASESMQSGEGYSDVSSDEEGGLSDYDDEPLEVAFRRAADAVTRRKEQRRRRRARRAQRRFTERQIAFARWCLSWYGELNEKKMVIDGSPSERDDPSSLTVFASSGASCTFPSHHPDCEHARICQPCAVPVDDWRKVAVKSGSPSESQRPMDMVYALVSEGGDVRVLVLNAGCTVGDVLQRSGGALGGSALGVRVNGLAADAARELASGDVVEVGYAQSLSMAA